VSPIAGRVGGPERGILGDGIVVDASNAATASACGPAISDQPIANHEELADGAGGVALGAWVDRSRQR
jgi:hypothetical protein